VSPAARKKASLGRPAALSAKPRQAPIVSIKDRPDGGLMVTVELDRPRWQRWLGAPGRTERQFGLDPYGREVFEACDGKCSVTGIIRRFAKSHQIALAEAEKAVTAFLKTLVAKGLVAMEIPTDGKGRRR